MPDIDDEHRILENIHEIARNESDVENDEVDDDRGTKTTEYPFGDFLIFFCY